MAHLSIHLFGSLQVTLDGEPVIGFRSDKVRALLAYLVVEASPQRREKLAGLLWPGWPESSARTNLRRALADLRLAIGDRAPSGDQQAMPHFLHISRQSIQFNSASDAWVDVTTFTNLIKTQGSPQETAHQLKKAVELCRGNFLEGFSLSDSPAFEEWTLLTRERLQRLLMETLRRLADCHEQQGEYEQALQHAWRQVELDSWQEQAHRQLMRLLALNGQRGAALAQYETCRQLLAKELGVEPSEQTRQLYERLLKQEWPPAATTLERETRPVGACPYRGLSAFREQDAPFFFGRADLVERLAEAVRQRPMVTVILGSSGSGKSSLVFAGLLPHLRDVDAGDWLLADFRPGANPFHNLAATLLPLLEPKLSETERMIETSKLAHGLSKGELALYQVVERVLEKNPGARRLLLVVDQFEELYTLCPGPDARRRFLDGLLAAVEVQSGRRAHPLALLLTLRADFMGQALAYRPFADALQDASLILGPMTREELCAAIVKPAEKQGAAFEAGLVERILDDVGPGDQPGNLPLLEFALTLLWEQQSSGWLTHAAYEEIGCVGGALARYADDVYAGLDEAEKERARRVFVQLVRPGEGTEDTRRVATPSELGKEHWALVQHLADKRLVVTGRDASSGRETVEIIHEALIQEWGQLRAWMQADRAFRTWQEDLRATMRQWEASARDQGALLRGAPLVQAESWLAERQDELNQAEREFIRAGVALREQREAERAARQQRELAMERRARRLLGALAGVLALATIVALVLTAFSISQRRQALKAYSLSLIANAQQALQDGDSATALVLALAANRIDDPPQESQRALLDAAYAPGARERFEIETLFPGAQGPATSLDISPDGQTALVGLADGTIVLWDWQAATEIRRLTGHTGKVNDVAFGPDGQSALSGGDDALVMQWDLNTGQPRQRLAGHTGAVLVVDYSSDGRRAVSGGYGGDSFANPGELFAWDLTTGQAIRRFEGHTAGVVTARFALDDTAILAGAGDAELLTNLGAEDAEKKILTDIILWDLASGEKMLRLAPVEHDAFSLAISPDGQRALIGSFYENVTSLVDLTSGEILQVLKGHHDGVSAVAFSAAGSRALTASHDGSLIHWDLATGKAIVRLDVQGGKITDVALSPDGRSALSVARDGELIRWDLHDAAEIARFVGHGDMVWDVALLPDGKRFVSISGAPGPSVDSRDTSVRLWDIATGEQLQTIELPLVTLFQAAVTPDGKTALVTSPAPVVLMLDVETLEEIGQLQGHEGLVPAVDISPDGRQALTASTDGTLILWDLASRQIVRRFKAEGAGALWAVAISPDGRTALADTGVGIMNLWNLETGAKIRSFTLEDAAPGLSVTGMAYLPDGRSAIACSGDGLVYHWDLKSGDLMRVLGRHNDIRTRVGITPDGRLALTSGMDGVLMLWDLETGELIRRFGAPGQMIFDIEMSADGSTAFSGSSDTTIVQWRLDNPALDELRAWIKANRYVRELSCEERELYQIEPLCATADE